jgi:hypothetical protein
MDGDPKVDEKEDVVVDGKREREEKGEAEESD